jgi:hypothetical protein
VWFVDAAATRIGAEVEPRVPIDAGDRLVIRCGDATAEVLFAHCGPGGRSA